MTQEVVVAFGEWKRYEFRVPDGELPRVTGDEAQGWLDDEWTALECEPARPSGKLLLLDKILGIARQAGEGRFAEHGDWARAFARNVAAVLQRPVVLVDVPGNRVG
jgi:hypothetical protein